jgi:hypothetical protein
MIVPYGQKERENCFSIVINALRAKEKTNFKQFLNNAGKYLKRRFEKY